VVVVGGGLVVVVGGLGGAVQGQGKMNSRDRMKDSSTSRGTGGMVHRRAAAPRRCWTGTARAGICLPRGAHAAPGCPEAPSRRLHPGVLPPIPAHLGSSCRCRTQMSGNLASMYLAGVPGGR